MYSLEAIHQMNEERCAEAKQARKEPYVFSCTDEVGELPFQFPNIGNYSPKGWELIEEYFVDSSGFDSDREPAMSVHQFIQVLIKNFNENPEYGYAITSAGQFQVYIGKFKRTK